MDGVGGYGRAPGYAPPLGRRRDALMPSASTSTPTSDWASLLRSGCYVVRGALIDGIPYTLGERRLYTTTGIEALPPDDEYTRSAALAITPGLSVSVEPDREKGVAGGRAFDLQLRRQSLEDEGLGAALFKSPSTTAILAADVTDVSTSTLTVDSTTGWATSGRLYIGHECVRYSATTSTSFDGAVRGIAGLAHYHAANPQSGYAEITDVPQRWTGRLVTIFDHLVGPDGRFLGTYWCVTDTYCRQLWRGQIAAEPQDTAIGKTIRCLPLVRLAAAEVGARFAFDVAHDGQANPLLWFNTTDQITLHADGSVDAAGPHNGSVGEFATLATWCAKAGADLSSDISGSGNVIVQASPTRPPLNIIVTGNFTTVHNASVRATAWFLAEGVYGTGASSDSSSGFAVIPIDFNSSPTAWLVLRAVPSEDFAVGDVPTSGTAIIESGNVRERVRWDAKKTITSQPDLVGLRLVEREVDGSPRSDPWRYGGRVTIVAGATGPWSDTFRTLMTSSGTGDRGTFDTLGFGFGMGLPDSWLDADAFDDEPMASTPVSAASDDRRPIEDVLGGWLALWSRCLVQRRNAAGEIVLSPVSMLITDDPSAQTIASADVLLDGHGTPEMMEAPNTVACDASGYEADTAKFVYRDASRVQAEKGQRTLSLRTPGATEDAVLTYAPGLLKRAEGQTCVELEAGPGSTAAELQPGDRVVLTTAHPTVYDHSSGTYGPASVNGIVHTWERDMWSDVTRLTVLLQGRATAAALLCPSARVTRVVSSTVVEVEAGDEDAFTINDEVRVYEPGNEGAVSVDATITAIDTETHQITVDAAVTSAPVLWVTFDDYATVVGDQADFMFVRSDRRWR